MKVINNKYTKASSHNIMGRGLEMDISGAISVYSINGEE